MINVSRCSFCKSKDLFYDSKRAQTFCRNCDAVIEENTLDANNVYANDFKSSKVQQWRKRRTPIYTSRERSLFTALNEIRRISSNLGLVKSIKKEAMDIYRQSQNADLIHGRSIEVVAAASVYLACRLFKVPRTLDEIANVSAVNKKDIRKPYNVIASHLNIKLVPISPTDLIPRFASELGLSGEVQSKAIEIVYLSKEKNLTSGRDPKAIAAATLYVASILLDNKKTQKEVSQVTGVSTVSIGARYKDLVDKLDLAI